MVVMIEETWKAAQEGHEQVSSGGRDINGDKKDGNHHQWPDILSKFSSHRNASLVYMYMRHEIIHVKAHAEQQHEHGNDPSPTAHGIIGSGLNYGRQPPVPAAPPARRCCREAFSYQSKAGIITTVMQK